MSDKKTRFLLFTIVLAVLSLLLLHAGFHKGGLWSERNNDFLAYHRAARAVLNGDLERAYGFDPVPGEYRPSGGGFKPKPYQYPPTLATLITPLGLLPYRVALVVWVLACFALLAWSFRVLDEVLCPPVSGVDKFMGFVLVYRLIHSDFANGNANVLVLGILVAALLLERRRRTGLAGGVLALATCIKVFPVLFVPWMLYRARWRMLGGFVAGLALWGVLVPGTILGPSNWGASFGAWSDSVLVPITVSSPQSEKSDRPADEGGDDAETEALDYIPGQSLRTLLHHVLRESDATSHDDEVTSVAIVDLPARVVDLVYATLGAGILFGLLWFFRRLPYNNVWIGPEMAAAALGCVLLSPMARKAHFVVLWPAAVVGFAVLRTSDGPRRKLTAALWFAAFFLTVMSSPGALGPWLSKRVMAFCPLTWVSFLLLALLLLPLRALRPSSPAPSPDAARCDKMS